VHRTGDPYFVSYVFCYPRQYGRRYIYTLWFLNKSSFLLTLAWIDPETKSSPPKTDNPMEISKILNPPSASGRDGSSTASPPPTWLVISRQLADASTEKPEKKTSERQSAASTVGQKEWEEKMKKKGMPTEGLNTFRVKKN
jgi:hypothetical protein